jgi:predicted NAD-dependent protein-ADP-ribosyltransferase YbiA (DUF1768 family)
VPPTVVEPSVAPVESINVYSKDKNGYEELSNLAVRPFTMQGRTFQSVEHAYQSLKSGTGLEEDVYNKNWNNGGLVARGTKGTKTINNWNTKTLMPAIMLRSFEQNPEATKLLLSTGTADLTHNVADKIWKDKFPELLMQIRDKLQKERSTSETPVSIVEVEPILATGPIMEVFAGDNTKLKVSDLEKMLEEYEAEWSYVIDKSYGEVNADGTPFKRNRDRAVVSESGEFWQQLLKNKIELNSLKRVVKKTLTFDSKKVTKVEKELLQKLMSMTRAEIAAIAQEASQAATSNYEMALGAGETFEQNITEEEIAVIEANNKAYLTENPDVTVEEGNMFHWSDGTITLDKDATAGERAVYLAHEIAHDKTARWLESNQKDTDVVRLGKMMAQVRSKLDKVVRGGVEGIDVYMLNERLTWDSKNGELGLLQENVAVLMAEPDVKVELEKLIGNDMRSLLQRVIDKIKQVLFGVEGQVYADKIYELVKAIEKKAEGPRFSPKSKSLLIKVKIPSAAKDIPAGFTPKEETHLTVWGFPEGKQLQKIFEEDPKKAGIVQKLIEKADLSYTERPEVYKIERDIEMFKDWANQDLGKHMVHEEAMIQLVDAPGVNALIDAVNKELGTKFPYPYPHISFAVKGTKFGIGIANKEAFDALTKTVMSDVQVKDQMVTEAKAKQNMGTIHLKDRERTENEAVQKLLKEGC